MPPHARKPASKPTAPADLVPADAVDAEPSTPRDESPVRPLCPECRPQGLLPGELAFGCEHGIWRADQLHDVIEKGSD